MKRWSGWLALALSGGAALLLAGCGGPDATDVGAPAAAPAPPALPASPGMALTTNPATAQLAAADNSLGASLVAAPVAGDVTGGDQAGGGLSGRATAADRKVISTARLSVEVESVEMAIAQARDLAAGLGGFVERLSSGGGSSDPRAELTIRLPQHAFDLALEQIEDLGRVHSRELGSEDVTEQFIDLSARLRSMEREEESLLALLERSQSVLEVLSVEKELARIRSGIEQFQAQLDYLERRVDLATIRVSLFPPGSQSGNPPMADYTMGVSNVAERTASLKEFVASIDGEVDRVYLTTYETEERAIVEFRVFAQDYDRAVEFVEEQGSLRRRELQEGINPSDGEALPPSRPDARIQVTYVDQFFQFPFWQLVLALLIALFLVGIVSYLMRLAYRRGRLRGRFF